LISSESYFHSVAATRDSHLAGSDVRKAVATEAEFHHLMAEIGVKICVNVDFGSFSGGVLYDEEYLGDELDDVARLQHQVALPPAAERRRRPRRLRFDMEDGDVVEEGAEGYAYDIGGRYAVFDV